MSFSRNLKRTRTALLATSISCAVLGLVMSASGFVRAPKAKISISVMDLTTGQPLAVGQTVAAGDLFQVTVTSNGGGDCAGQFVVTALGAPGFPPAALVQVMPFIVGAATGNNSAVGGVLTANALGTAANDWKISASCNNAGFGQFDFDRFEFFAL
jgi:hypothetical protein